VAAAERKGIEMDHDRAGLCPGKTEASSHPAADSRGPDATGAMEGRFDAQRVRRLAGMVTLVVVLAVICYLALVPNARGEFLGFLPQKLRRWICEHDDFNNVTGFAVLGLVAFRIRGSGLTDRGTGVAAIFRRIFAYRIARLAALMVLVCVFELSQFFIPGRMSSLQDVCTGWSGLFAAWLVSEIWWGSGGEALAKVKGLRTI
jgi:hypothetical protein